MYGPENPVLVAELDLFKGQNISEKTFDSLNGYHIVIVLTHSLEVDYPGRDKEKIAFEAVCQAMKKRCYVGLLYGGATELFKVARS